MDSVFLVVTAEDLDRANEALETAGLGSRCIRYPLSSDGSFPPSYYCAEWLSFDKYTKTTLPEFVTVELDLTGFQKCEVGNLETKTSTELEEVERVFRLDLSALKESRPKGGKR